MLRLFTWNDVGALALLLEEAQRAKGDPTRFTLQDAEEYFHQPDLRPARDCFLAQIDGTVAGFALVVPELNIGRAIVEGAVRPSLAGRGIGEALLAQGLAHGKALGARAVHVCAGAGPMAESTRRVLAAVGFLEVQRQWHMRLDLGSYAVPPGSYADIRPMAPGEEPVMADIQNRAFAGSWGFAPNTPEEIAYRVRMRGGAPRDVLFLMADARPAAYCWTRLTETPAEMVGVIWMIGVDPNARGRGRGRTMLEASIEHLNSRGARAVELTVYQDNVPAVELYRSMGFRSVREIIWYEKQL